MPNYSVIGNDRVIWKGYAKSISGAITHFAEDFYKDWLNKDEKNTVQVEIELPYITVYHAHDKDSDVFTVTVV